MYEVGDKVIYQGADKNAYKKVGVLKSIEEKDGKPQLTVEFEGGETFTAPVDDWSKEFTNAATNAKFKVGDKVRIIGGGVETIARVYPKGRGTGLGPQEVDFYATRESGGFITDEDISGVANAARSTNSVVRNTGKAMISRVGSDWYYSWADGAKDGREGPFRSEEEARVSAKQDGFAVANAARSTNSVVRNAMAKSLGDILDSIDHFITYFGDGLGTKQDATRYYRNLLREADAYKSEPGMRKYLHEVHDTARKLGINSSDSNSRSTNSVVANAMAANRRVARNSKPEFGKVEDELRRMRSDSLDLLRRYAALGAPVNGNEIAQLIDKLMQKTRNKLFA